jgi:hypothetical protein
MPNKKYNIHLFPYWWSAICPICKQSMEYDDEDKVADELEEHIKEEHPEIADQYYLEVPELKYETEEYHKEDK